MYCNTKYKKHLQDFIIIFYHNTFYMNTRDKYNELRLSSINCVYIHSMYLHP